MATIVSATSTIASIGNFISDTIGGGSKNNDANKPLRSSESISNVESEKEKKPEEIKSNQSSKLEESKEENGSSSIGEKLNSLLGLGSNLLEKAKEGGKELLKKVKSGLPQSKGTGESDSTGSKDAAIKAENVPVPKSIAKKTNEATDEKSTKADVPLA